MFPVVNKPSILYYGRLVFVLIVLIVLTIVTGIVYKVKV